MFKAINLECVRGERRLFHRLNFHLTAGECLLVRGENGSGKTSLLRILAGFTPPGSGAIHWRNRPVNVLDNEYRRELLYCGHAVGLKEDLSATENIMFAMALAHESVSERAVHEALCQAGLHGKEHLTIRELSQGQKRRVSLVRLLLQKRALWVLDEPLTALDAQASRWLLEMLDQHLSQGGLAVLTTHQDIALANVTQTLRVSA